MHGKKKRTHGGATLERAHLLLRARAQMCHVAIVILLQAAQSTACQHNIPYSTYAVLALLRLPDAGDPKQYNSSRDSDVCTHQLGR